MMTVHLTKLASQMNVLTPVHSQYVAAGQGANLRDTRAFVFVPLACKATPMFPALKLVVNHMMTVLMMRNVTFQPHHQGKGNVSDFVSPLPVPKVLAVKQRTTEKYAPAITPCKEMATLLVYHVSCSLSIKVGMNFGKVQ